MRCRQAWPPVETTLRGLLICIPRGVNLRAIGGAQPQLRPRLPAKMGTRRVGDALSFGFCLGVRVIVFNCVGEDCLGKGGSSPIRQAMLRSRSSVRLTSSMPFPLGPSAARIKSQFTSHKGFANNPKNPRIVTFSLRVVKATSCCV